MASTAKSSTKWGSFFEKAVAGVESRLDNILGDEDDSKNDTSKVDKQTDTLKTHTEKYGSANGLETGRSPG